MATDRIYGDYQFAGVKVTTAAKSQVNSAGTDAYAPLVALVGGDGAAAASATNPAAVAETGSAAFATGQVTVPATANGILIVAARAGRRAVTIINSGTTIVALGAPATGLTVTNGALLPGAAGASITIPTAAAVYGIVGTGTQVVSYLETY